MVNFPEGSPEGTENYSVNDLRDNSQSASKEKSSLRLKVFKLSRFDIKKPKVEGLEKIPPTPCVIVTTHLSDIDVQEVVMAVAGRRKVGVASQVTNLTFPPFKPFVAAIGKDNFFPVTNLFKKGHAAYSLRLEDLQKMQEGIREQGRTMIIAGHSPTHDWKLPEKPGIAAVVLAHMAGVPLIPAIVDIESSNPVAQTTDNMARVKNFITRKRPSAKIIFGEPIELAEIQEEELASAIGLYSPDKRRSMTQEELLSARGTLSVLKGEADKMMLSMASKLPTEKRGKWGKDDLKVLTTD